MSKYLLAAFISALISSYAFGGSTNPPVSSNGMDMYVSMCKDMTDMPAADGGEDDLKGNGKLDSYCHCFSDKFVARMKKFDPSKIPSPEQTQRDQFEMRRSCRAQLGLPAPKPVNLANQ